MNDELKELLRSVLKEELKPIHQQLDKFDKRFDEVDSRFSKIDERFDEVDHCLQTIEGDVKSLIDNMINGLGPYFERITEQIDEVIETTNKQQVIIEALSARTLKH
ncbi:hypothetical protein DS745_04140 [Anaerobacillus alkaliphilus]|uniref:t-SNARE coiled-coil homology domain-containing protein n=1 Tax=Anaerobacillus alkaliphilus TaxID=1548597 RepID=A0A4Q0VYQ0_9BACI|nr:hypothetical protein [Anaerobacillus alkaliphilus]RXJ04580.1 hypothetical protein DS745_04140 [Anaerobacillus alkaliphilus]